MFVHVVCTYSRSMLRGAAPEGSGSVKFADRRQKQRPQKDRMSSGILGRIPDDTPLIIAIGRGRDDEVAALLAGGADPNEHTIDTIDNSDAWRYSEYYLSATPLFIACHQGHTEIAAALIAAGAKVNQAMDGGVTPLFIACQNGHTEIAAALTAAGAKVYQAKDTHDNPALLTYEAALRMG